MATTPPKLILITGVTRGLGRALGERFASQGHHVLGCGRSVEDVEDLRQQLGSPHDIQTVDVADDRAVRRWAESLLAHGHAPDLLLNNAGLVNPKRVLWEIGAEEFGRVIDVNIKGVANVLRHFVPAMIARKTGVIVNFSSTWGRSTSPEFAPYCATKWAIEGLTAPLAQELPKGLAAVALNPGVINTDMLHEIFGSGSSNFPNARRWSEPVVPFLLRLGPSDNGKALTAPSRG